MFYQFITVAKIAARITAAGYALTFAEPPGLKLTRT